MKKEVGQNIDELAINNLRVLSCEMIQRANSGHPGIALGAAPMMWALFSRHLRVDPKDPEWSNRDRFVLSAGHGSALLYAMLHVSGFDLSINDLKNFRRFGSKTPGHPERGHVPGVEATTGPLGQGIGMAVGMALAERTLAARLNKKAKVVDHFTYCLVGDGDLMEGISHEAASFAGNQRLSKLIVLYDSNDVSLDGPASRSFRTDVCRRFESYGWDTQLVANGNDVDEIDRAIEKAKKTDKPSLIEIKTTIGFGADKAGTNAVHGAPLGENGLENLRTRLEYDGPAFTVLPEVKAVAETMIENRGKKAHDDWRKVLDDLAASDEECFDETVAVLNGKRCLNALDGMTRYESGAEASRDTSHKVIQVLAEKMDNLVGGSADLSSSDKTAIDASGLLDDEHPTGRNVAYGVREFAQGTIMNGMALHGGLRVFGGTFLVFSDYLRGAIRLSALQKLPVVYVFTHDSIAVGEDGPTHEPVEQLMSLRSLPNVDVLRPADPNEVIAAWQQAIDSVDHPTVLVLTRQKLPVLSRTSKLADAGVARGGYVVSPQKGMRPSGILIASGSEVSLAIKAQERLFKLGEDVSVVSMPSMERFDAQPQNYKDQVLPPSVRRRTAIEMGSTRGWERYVGLDGTIVGLDEFGASGAMDDVLANAGFTVENVVLTFQKTNVTGENHLSAIRL